MTPYINRTRKERLDSLLDELVGSVLSPGELNHAIVRLCSKFAEHLGYGARVPGYESWRLAIGVLECAKAELCRRVATPAGGGDKDGGAAEGCRE